MPPVPTKRTRTLRELGRIKVTGKENSSLKLPEVNRTPEARQGAMINPEVVEVTKMVQETMREEDLATEMTDLSPKAGQILRLRAVSDVERQTTNHRTVTSRRKPV